MDAMAQHIATLETRLHSQHKSIEHLKYRNVKLQMQIHQKQRLKSDFLIVFESSNNDNAFLSSMNFDYNSDCPNTQSIKPLTVSQRSRERVIFSRVKDCSYAFAANCNVDEIIGITAKAKAQHKASLGTSRPITLFNVIYRIGGDTMSNAIQSPNIATIVGTDVVFELPALAIPRFNHRIIHSKLHGILVVGGEPMRKDDANRERKQLEKELEAKK